MSDKNAAIGLWALFGLVGVSDAARHITVEAGRIAASHVFYAKRRASHRRLRNTSEAPTQAKKIFTIGHVHH